MPEKRSIHTKVPESLWKAARIAAIKLGVTLSSVVEKALRQFVEESEKGEGNGNDEEDT